ncbi:unnamed protein product [Phytophthora lilii]|uniref:Unnamed protein product n=1 Tax=Phytophthora lilii TaxID=2077276 RepID=A0A9W6TEA5_9STRA|nr:unnamed protein product [Phytophthora lilii]
MNRSAARTKTSIIASLVSDLFESMFDSKWEVRHGAVLSLRQILLSSRFTSVVEIAPNGSSQLNLIDMWLEECLIRCICVLALDQFVDYSADGSISPVREVCAQVFGILLGSLSSEDTLVRYLQVVRTLFSGSTWQACHGGLLGLRYLIRAHSNHAQALVPLFFDDVVTAFSQDDSEEDVIVLATEMLKDFAPYLDQVEPTGILKAALLMWESLKRYDKVGLVISSVIQALNAWCDCPSVATLWQSDKGVRLAMWENLLYSVPMLHHHSQSIRESSATCVAAIFSAESVSMTSSMAGFAEVFLPHLLLQVLLEREESVQQSLLAAWKKVVSSLSVEKLLVPVATAQLPTWMKQLWSPDDIKCLNVEIADFNAAVVEIAPSDSADRIAQEKMSSRVVFAEAIGFAAAHVPLSCACVTEMVKVISDGMYSSSGERQCGALLALSKWAHFEKHLKREEQSQRIHFLLDSAGPLLASFANNQWKMLQPDAVNEGRPVYYSEQLEALKRVGLMEARIIDIFSSVRISLQPRERESSMSAADISRQIAEHIALFPYGKLQNHPKEFEMAHFKRQDLFLVDEFIQQSFSRFCHRIQGLGSCAFCELLPIPKKSGFLVKALMDSVKEEEEPAFRTISAQTIADFIVSQAHTQKKCVAKIISNLCNLAVALVGVADCPFDGMMGVNSSQTEQSSSVPPEVMKKTKVRVEGAKAALCEICKRAGGSLFVLCPAFEDVISKAWRQPNVDELTIQRCMYLIVLVLPHMETGAKATCLSWLNHLALLTQNTFKDQLTRCTVAQAVATICKCTHNQDRENAMLIVYNSIFVAFSSPSSGDCTSTDSLEGSVMVLDRIVNTLGANLMPYVPSLVYYAMKTMSSQYELVRTLAAGAFANLVPLIPLQMDLELRDSDQALPDSLRTIVNQNAVSRSFLESFTEGKAVQHTDVQSWLAPETSLRVYQQHGVDWLCFMANNNLHGILADEMGLGKTLQTLSAMAAVLAKACASGVKQPCLIVCPPIIVHQWIQEAKKYIPGVFASIIDYSIPASDRKCLNFGDGITVSDRRPTMIVTTYSILRSDIAQLGSIDYSFVVLDEAHLIRNPSTAMFRAVLQLHASHRVALSGTPLQNKVTDLWALFEFLMPGYLGDFAAFRREFVLPITKSKERNATTKQKELAAMAIAQLHQKVLPFILRRTKEQVLEELPPKIISNVLLPLSPLQKRLYSLASSIDSETTISGTSSMSKNPEPKPMPSVLTNLQLLRKICVHPALVAQEAITRRLSSKEKGTLCDWKSSGKMTGLRDLLVECCDIAAWDKGSRQAAATDVDNIDDSNLSPHRCLVFAHLQKTLDLTEQMLRDALPGVAYRRLDGQTPHPKRADIVQSFNADPSIDVLLLTTSVGGLGLTLTGADTVIFIEHSWNPFVDLQAMDRAHRIGQKRTVRVFRLIMEESLEEHILNLQEFKEQVAATVVQKSDAHTSMNTSTKGVLNLLQASSSVVAAKELRSSISSMAREENQNMAGVLPRGAQELLEQIGELWDESQYDSLAFPEITDE